MENWVTIADFPKYSVSHYGRIRKNSNERLLNPTTNQYGVVCVGLMRENARGEPVQFRRSVPLIVATTFVPKLNPSFDTPINLDGNRHNNHINNLAWRPRWFAIQYNKQFRIPYEYPVVTPIMDTATGEVFEDSFECARKCGLLEKDVVLSILNRTVVWPTYQKFELVPD